MRTITGRSTVMIILLAGAITFTGLQCRWKVTKGAMKTGEQLKSSIENFEDNRQKLSEKVVISLEDAQKKLTKDDPDLPKIAKDWEVEWNRIQDRYQKMKDDFDKTGTNSQAYFAQLDELSNNISNEVLRKQELAKNAKLKKKWDVTYQKASVSIAKITQVLESGKDFHMVLVASSIRQKLEQNVDELENIARQAKELLTDLEAFTQAGRALVEG
ncbi:MAG: hypothetical protein KDC28_15960 [Saprospiraceae bacterium]|nr:hypothetical protein [Saprospiraceae bacterium]MCB9317956.1 hypothetical protein [Lewinellaceae bacterium]